MGEEIDEKKQLTGRDGLTRKIRNTELCGGEGQMHASVSEPQALWM